MMDPGGRLLRIVACFIEGLALILAWREAQVRKQVVGLYAMIVVSAAPTWAVLQPNEHMLYMANALQCTLVAAVAIASCRQLWLLLAPRLKTNASRRQATIS
jgi:peptidoglycan/LPS O-acetylase OafA/YrhL